MSLSGNGCALSQISLPDKVTEQAVTTCSIAHKTDKTTQCTSHNDHLITAMNAKSSTNYSVTEHSKSVKNPCADKLSIVDSHQSKKLSPAHSSNISVKPSNRSTQGTYHRLQNCAQTLPTVDINSNSHETCIRRIADVRCENLSAQHLSLIHI